MRDDDRFIQDHGPLVESIARKLQAEMDLGCELDDLVGYGYRGLVEARARFDATRGVQFNTFAYYRVRGAILDGVRKMAWLPRRAHAKIRAAEAADQVGEQVAEQRAADPASRGRTADTVRSMDEALGRITAAFTLSAVGQDESEPAETPEEGLLDAELRRRVRGALAVLPERERTLVAGFYFEGRRFDEVAAELGISKSWASRLHGKALSLLRDELGDD
jgi:RNA polymerase sigma factor for flagellar operon FliA